MRVVSESEVLKLKFGDKVEIMWINSPFHDKNEKYCGVVFGKKIGWEDGAVDDLRTIAECTYNNACLVYLLTE